MPSHFGSLRWVCGARSRGVASRRGFGGWEQDGGAEADQAEEGQDDHGDPAILSDLSEFREAGRDGDLFSDDAIAQIHDAARGKPRTVNNLAIAALIATYAAAKKIVDQSAARAAVSEVISAE